MAVGINSDNPAGSNCQILVMVASYRCVGNKGYCILCPSVSASTYTVTNAVT